MAAKPGPNSERDTIRATLLAARVQILNEVAALDVSELALATSQRTEGGIAGDAADVVSDLTELQVDEAVEVGIRQRLADVDAALRRLESGRYSECEDCGGAIDPARLRALPWARRCLSCQERAEFRTMPVASPEPEVESNVPLPERCPYCQETGYRTELGTDEDGLPTGLVHVHCASCERILAQVTHSEWALATETSLPPSGFEEETAPPPFRGRTRRVER
jgi:RNA polymerase-binding transcription factor DksA